MSDRTRPRLSPEAAAIVRAQLSRRSVLAGALGVGALAACGTSGTSGTGGATGGASGAAKPTAAADMSDTDKKVNWANWTLYLDYDEKTKTYPTLEAFQKQSGIKATYAEDIEDNDTLLRQDPGQLKNGQDIGKDIIVFTDWMAARVIRQGYVQKLDTAQIPNKKNIAKPRRPRLRPGPQYSLTWQGGFAGLAGTRRRSRRPEDVADLWKPELKGRVEVLSEMRDTIGLIMGAQGVDIAGTSPRTSSWPGSTSCRSRSQRADPLGEGQLLQGGPDRG